MRIRLIQISIGFIFGVIASEIVLRIFGYPLQYSPQDLVQLEGGAPVFSRDEKLGFRFQKDPLQKRYLNGNEFWFFADHDPDGFRKCNVVDSLPQIWVFGCSFTYGWGVNQGKTWPERFNGHLKEYSVRNFGVPGYSTLQSFLLFQEEIKKRKKPIAVILAYASFHDQRNTGTERWLEAIRPTKLLSGCRIPVLRDSTSAPEYVVVNPGAPAIFRSIAIIDFLHNYNLNRAEDEWPKAGISDYLVTAFSTASMAAGLDFSVAVLDSTTRTDLFLTNMKSRNITAFSAFSGAEPENFLSTNDPHPSAVGHEKIAGRVFENWITRQEFSRHP